MTATRGSRQSGAHASVDRDWVLWARCRGMDTTTFFPQKEDGRLAAARAESAAKSVCRSCPVIAECRETALEAGESHGIWGGMTYAERRAFARAQKLGRALSA